MSFLVPPRRPSRERLDDPSLPAGEMRRSLADLQLVNRRWGASRALERHLRSRTRSLPDARVAVLDVGAGSGEVALRLRRSLSEAGLRATVVALDLQWRHLAAGRALAGEGPPAPVAADAFALPFPDGAFDYAVSTLFFHHFSPEENRRLLAEFRRVSRRGFAALDLRRHRIPEIFVAIAGRFLFQTRVSVEDGAASVRQAYTRDEALDVARSVDAHARAQRIFPFRLLVSGRRVMSGTPYDAVVVGAGPAGSAAAATLARAGREVLLLEKDRFPRPKVCGEYLSASALDRLEPLGLRRAVLAEAERIDRGVVHPAFGGKAVEFGLPRPGAGISRRRLDALLAARAGDLGAETTLGARVTSIEGRPGAFRVRFRTGREENEIEARIAIGAWGRWDALDRAMGRQFLGAPGRFLGWSLDFDPDESLAGQVRLYVFPGGYCGLSRIEGGRVHLAGVAAETRHGSLGGGWPAMLVHARKTNPDLDRALRDLSPAADGFHGAGPVVFASKPPVENGILMVGDAAGVIDPFSGEGQASALASGILAADVVERGLGGEAALAGVPADYARAWRAAFHRRFAWSAAFRRLMLSPSAGRLAARLAGRGVARFAVARLAATSPSRPRL